MTLLLLFNGGDEAAIVDRNKRRSIHAGTAIAQQLFAARYNTAATGLKEVMYHPANVGVRWALPGGLQRMELTIKAKSKYDARNRYAEGLGERWVLLDGMIDRPIADGWCYSVTPDGIHVHYEIAGAWKRHSDQYETTQPVATTTDTDVFLKAILTGHVPAVSATQTNIGATSTDVGNYVVDLQIGERPDRIIDDLLKMGNSSDQIIDYWLVPAPMNGILPRLPLPYLAARDNTAAVSWQTRERDLSAKEMSRNIWELVNDVVVGYTAVTTLTDAATKNDTTIKVDSVTGFNVGDEIQIQTDEDNRFFTTAITDITGSVFTINDPLPGDASVDNLVKNNNTQFTSAATDTTSQNTYWTRQARVIRRELNLTQAQQYRDALLAQYKNAAQLTSFTIGSGYVKNTNGSRLPVWRMLINPGLVRINDLFADGTVFSNSIDGRQSFRVVALDYDHNRRSMQVTPDTLNEARLDVILQRGGMESVGQMINRS